MNKEVLKGSIDLMILALLSQKDSYGYQLTKDIQLKSQSIFEISEGTLYPALKRLELKSLIQSYWVTTAQSTRRKYYHLTELGQAELIQSHQDWQTLFKIINLFMEAD